MDDDGYRYASSLGTFDPADLAVPENVDVSEDTVIIGTGEVSEPDATVICDGSSASTELVDAVVDTPEGPVELPPIEMVNPAFACGPGWDD